MVRTEATRFRLVLLVIALALALLTFGMVSVAQAAGPDMPEHELQPQPIEGKVTKLTRPIRCPDRSCLDDGRGCTCKGSTENRPPIRIPIELAVGSDVSSAGLTPDVQPVTGLVSELISPIRCPDRMCPDGGIGCKCRGGDRPPFRLLIGQPGSPLLTE